MWEGGGGGGGKSQRANCKIWQGCVDYRSTRKDVCNNTRGILFGKIETAHFWKFATEYENVEGFDY